MPTFHTVKEAAAITGKSPSSIRRVIYPIIQNEQHPDRSHIHPTPDEVRSLRMQGVTFGWQISDELLRREIPDEPAAEQGSGRPNPAPAFSGQSDIIAMLQAELTIKNEQIATQSRMLSQQMELISGLSERLREGNLLIGSLQQQLRLGDGTPTGKGSFVAADVADAKPSPTPAPQKPSTRKEPKTAAPKETPQRKRGLFRWFR